MGAMATGIINRCSFSIVRHKTWALWFLVRFPPEFARGSERWLRGAKRGGPVSGQVQNLPFWRLPIVKAYIGADTILQLLCAQNSCEMENSPQKR